MVDVSKGVLKDFFETAIPRNICQQLLLQLLPLFLLHDEGITLDVMLMLFSVYFLFPGEMKNNSLILNQLIG